MSIVRVYISLRDVCVAFRIPCANYIKKSNSDAPREIPLREKVPFSKIIALCAGAAAARRMEEKTKKESAVDRDYFHDQSHILPLDEVDLLVRSPPDD